MEEQKLTRDEIFAQIKSILADDLFVTKEIKEESKLADFNLESLDEAELFTQLEKRLDIVFDNHICDNVSTVSDLITVVEKTIAEITKSSNDMADIQVIKSREERSKVISRLIAISANLTDAIKPHQMSGFSRFKMDLELSDDAYAKLAKSIKDEFNTEISLRYLKDIESIEDLADEILRK